MQTFTKKATATDPLSPTGPPTRSVGSSHAPQAPAHDPTVAECRASEDATAPFADVSELRNFRPDVWTTIDRLYRAAQLAADCDLPRAAFSVAAKDLFMMGLWAEELRWLIAKHVLESVRDHVTPQTTSLPDVGLVITDQGIELMEQCMVMGQLDQCLVGSPGSTSDLISNTSMKPSWDTERHELNCGGKLVKKFKWRAANQEAILAAFEEDGWPAHIDDPLPQEGDVDPKRRLADAIKSLNRHQRVPLIRFCGDGTGEGVLWEFKR